MSFSFDIHAASKAKAKEAAAAKLDEVVAAQPEHAIDIPAGRAALNAAIDAMGPDRDDCDVHVRMHGSLSWTGMPAVDHVTGVSLGFSTYFVKRP